MQHKTVVKNAPIRLMHKPSSCSAALIDGASLSGSSIAYIFINVDLSINLEIALK